MNAHLAVKLFDRLVRWVARTSKENRYCLILEDDEIDAAELKDKAEQCGWTADVVGSGTAALAVMEHVRYSVVFVDINLPGMNGAKFAERVHKDRRFRENVHIIFVTGSLDTLVELKGDGRFIALLKKNVTLEGVRDALNSTNGYDSTALFVAVVFLCVAAGAVGWLAAAYQQQLWNFLKHIL